MVGTGKVSVSLSCAWLTVSQECSDHLQAHPALYCIAGESVSKIVYADALDFGLSSDGIPGFLEVHQIGALLISRDDIGVVEHLGHGLQHFDGRLVQEDGFGAGLGVLEA